MTTFDTNAFRAIAAKNEHALLALADTFANEQDTQTMLAILPAFLERKESGFYEIDRYVDVMHNGVTSTSQTSFVKAFEKALWPIDGAPRWTAEQRQLFDALKPFLTRTEQSGHSFVSEAVRKVTDPGIVEVVNFAKSSVNELMTRAATENNAAVFAALASKANPTAAAEWIDSQVRGLTPSSTTYNVTVKGLARIWDQPEGPAAFETLLSVVDETREAQFRMDVLAQWLVNKYELAQPMRWTREGITETMGANSFAQAMDIVKRHADIAAQQQTPEEVAASMAQSQGLPVHRLMKAALLGNCAALLEAGQSIFQKGSAWIDPFAWVLETKLQSKDDLKSTIETLSRFGFPLGNEPVTLGQRPRVCGLEHLVKIQGDPTHLETKLMLFLNAGADPLVPNHLNKTPAALIKNKAERDRWNGVIKSHKARNSAMALIDEMEKDTAPAP